MVDTDTTPKYKECTESVVHFYDEQFLENPLFREIAKTSYKLCEAEIKKKSRYMIKFVPIGQCAKELHGDSSLALECTCVAIDNHGDCVVANAYTEVSCHNTLPYESLFEKLPTIKYRIFDEDSIPLQNPLIDLVLATNLPPTYQTIYDDDLSIFGHEHITLIEAFLTQLKVVAKMVTIA